MEETMVSAASKPWKLYHNPLYSPHPDPSISHCTHISSSLSDLTKSMESDLQEAKAEINSLKSELEFERTLRMKISDEIEEERTRREAVDRVNDEEKKMMRVAEVFREGKEKPNLNISPISVLRRSASPEPENPHIKRGIKGSVEFQRVVKAMCSTNKSNKQLNSTGNYKLECQKAQLKILLRQRSPVHPNSYFIT